MSWSLRRPSLPCSSTRPIPGKRIGLLHELLPRATTIAVLTIPSALVPVDRSVLAGIRNPSQNRPPVRRSYVSFRRERTWSRSAVRWSGHRILLRTLRGPCSFRTHQGLQRAGAGTLSRSVGCGGALAGRAGEAREGAPDPARWRPGPGAGTRRKTRAAAAERCFISHHITAGRVRPHRAWTTDTNPVG
jgi:hypothetical protein